MTIQASNPTTPTPAEQTTANAARQSAAAQTAWTKRSETNAVSGMAADDNTTFVELIAAPGVGVSFYITDIIVIETGAATAGWISIYENTSTSLISIGLEANLTRVVNLKTPLKITANKNVGFLCDSTRACLVSIIGFTAPG